MLSRDNVTQSYSICINTHCDKIYETSTQIKTTSTTLTRTQIITSKMRVIEVSVLVCDTTRFRHQTHLQSEVSRCYRG